MAEDPVIRGGWLPPSAPDGKAPPRFAPPAEPRWQPPAGAADPRAARGGDDAGAPAEPSAVAAPDAAAGHGPPGSGSGPARPSFGRSDGTPVPAGERNRTAVWALSFGLVGVTLLALSLGTLFFITLPCSIAAWVLARRARERIAGGEIARGEGQATAALWLGRIGVVAGVAAAVVVIALLASGFDFEEFRDDLERELERQRQRDDGDGVRTALERLAAAAGGWPSR